MYTNSRAPNFWAPLFQTLALLGIASQIRLLAGELADTGIFFSLLAAGFLLALFASKRRLSGAVSILVLLLFPWVLRELIALPRIFYPSQAILLDTLLATFDRNLFVFLLPLYWISGATYLALRSRTFIRYHGIFLAGILMALFPLLRKFAPQAYPLPILMILVFSGIAFSVVLTFILSPPPEDRPTKAQTLGTVAVTLALISLASFFAIHPLEERALSEGGGLIKPKLFRFDFSQFLRLESEITLNDDLVLIVRKNDDDSHILLRRYILSAYTPKKGFSLSPSMDEPSHPSQLPAGRMNFPVDVYKERRSVLQEYYFVNFDPSAFIALNQPTEVIPLTVWDAASFSSAYSVRSDTSEALPFELMDTVRLPISAEVLGMTDQAYRWYTDFGNDQRIVALSNQITQGLNGYWEKIQAIYERLKYGEYRYSLKPGLAPDGDQLGRFLFDAKKGYCSYFAFSMALLLRSQGIPARVAVGFFVDPDTKTFDYYPVRSDMAHAWVEVYFPRYGWIEYDPTTEKLAEGENFRFSKGVQPELFEKLLREILQNRSRLVPKEELVTPKKGSLLPELAKQTLSFIKHQWKALTLGCLLILFLLIRLSLYLRALFAPKARTRVILLDRHLRRRLFLSGYPQRPGESGGEYYGRLETALKVPLKALYSFYSAARFAPEFTQRDAKDALEAYRIASARLRVLVPWFIRLRSWVFPVLPYLRHFRVFRIALFIIACPLLFVARDTLGAQSPVPNADSLYTQAQKAQDAENWDRAIGLFQQGETTNPSDPRFPLSLGELYETRKLYNLAWEEYKKAELLLPEDVDVLYRLSNVAGRLNRNETSVQYLKRVLEKQGDNKDAIADLAWMDFKLHRLREGETLLLDALRRFGKDRGFSMTLGTIYSELFEYEKSKEQYMEAIEDAQKAGAKIFVAVARYNLSILESRYYNYAEAFKQTSLSLAAADRTSGHLARGELYLKQLDFPKTFTEYESAYSLDVSPLSKINIAQANQIAGRLAEARAYAEESLSAADLSWMINYGTDVKRHRRDIYDILKDTYKGLAMERNFVPIRTPQDWLKNLSLQLYYRFKATVNRLLYEKYSLQIAQEYRAQAQILDANINFYNALQDYPGRANSYLSEARAFEVARIPASQGTYDLEQGRLLHRRDLLERATLRLDPQWERDLLADTWTELALQLQREGDPAGAEKYADRLYAINPGALRQRGLRLPVLWDFQSPGIKSLPVSAEKALVGALSTVGFQLLSRDRANSEPDRPRYRLTLTVENTRLRFDLYDSIRGVSVVSKTFDLSSFKTEELLAAAEAWGNAVFIRSGKP